MDPAVTPSKDGSLLVISVVPRGGKTCLSGIMADGTLRIRLGAPPVDNQANDALIRWLQTELDVAESQVMIKSGQTSRRKTVWIGLPPDECLRRISTLIC